MRFLRYIWREIILSPIIHFLLILFIAFAYSEKTFNTVKSEVVQPQYVPRSASEKFGMSRAQTLYGVNYRTDPNYLRTLKAAAR